MTPGISTSSFYPMYTEKALSWLANNNVHAAEIFFNAPSELEESFVRELAHEARAGEVDIVSVHPFTSGIEPLLFFSNYQRRTQDSIEFYKRTYFNAANILGAHLLVLHGDHRMAVKPLEAYFDMFAALAEAGQSMGVTVAHENVPRCISWCPDFFEAMGKYLPDASFVLDTKQAIRAGFTPMQMLEAMGSRIAHVHISDNTESEDCLPIGRGTMDFEPFFNRLIHYGFDAAVLMEIYSASYDSPNELVEPYKKLCAMTDGKFDA